MLNHQIYEEWAMSFEAHLLKLWLIDEGLNPAVAHEVAIELCGDEAWMNFSEE